MDRESLTELEREFSLVRGGPLYHFLLLTRLLQVPMGWLHRRIAACLLVTWLPLAVMTAVAGTFVGGVDVPFLADLSNIRFVFVLPMLIAAEPIVHRRIKTLVAQFVQRELIAPTDRRRFDAIIVRAMWLRDSSLAEIVLVILAYTAASMAWRAFGILPGTTWYATSSGGIIELTLAGNWLVWISLPIARFMILRWYYRLFIWYFFLWQVSRLQLKVDPLHPDRAGGLGFLSESTTAYSPVLMAQSLFLSAMIGNQIWHLNAQLPDFQLEILGFVAGMLFVVLLPLTFFILQLVEAKFEASNLYGILASRYVREFRLKWLGNAEPTDEALLGSPDIQSLADLGNSFQSVDSMRVIPFEKTLILKLVIVISLPLLPLVLTMIPLEELMPKLIKLLL